MDGIAKEEITLLFRLYDEYNIAYCELGRKFGYLASLGDGLMACHNLAVQIILAHDKA